MKGVLVVMTWLASGCSFLKVSSSEKDLAQLARDGAVLLDVRTESEFASGHIPGMKT